MAAGYNFLDSIKLLSGWVKKEGGRPERRLRSSEHWLFADAWVWVPAPTQQPTLTATPVPWDLTPSSDFCGHTTHEWYTNMHAGKTLTHKTKQVNL